MIMSILDCCLSILNNKNHVYVASVVATYWVVSISLVYLNKVLMSNDAISIPAPLFVTWFQCIVTVIICWIAGQVGERARASSNGGYSKVSQHDGSNQDSSSSPQKQQSSFFAQFPKAEYRIGTAKRVFPLSIIFVGMMTFNNLCLKYVEVSFYNVARSLTIVFNVFFTRIFLSVPTSLNTSLCLGIVIFGFFLGSNGEINFSLFGTCMGVCSSLFVSLNSIFTKKVLPVVNDDHWRLTFYNNVNACILFVPLLLYFEMDAVVNAMDNQLVSPIFWTAMSVAGVFGFSIGIVTVLQIKATSPLSHNISGTAKAAVQSMMAFYLWGNKPTILGVLGIFTVLGGSLLYTLVKMRENAAKASPKPETPTSADAKDEEEGNNKSVEMSKA